MKKRLFIASLFLTSVASAQSLTQTNEPAIGASLSMFVCDSSYLNYESTNGTGVTWDFSDITGYESVPSKMITVEAPATTDYDPATKVTVIDGLISTYWTSSSTARTSQGFVYSDQSVGDVEVKLSTDDEKVADYPFAFGNSFTDAYEGTLYNGSLTPTGAVPCTGTATAEIDGQGTLVLPGNVTLSNVIRYKVVESSNATVSLGPVTLDITVVRTQYDYYDINNSSLPVFTHLQIEALNNGSALNSTTLVLSSVEPEVLVGLSDNAKNDFVVYPNPTQGKITLKGDFASNASAVVVDQAGRVVVSVESLNNGTTLDLSSVQKGMYSVVITNNGAKTTKTISVN